MKSGKQKVNVPSCVVSYNKYKNGVDFFDNHMETYFSSIQGKKWYWPLFVNAFETSLVAAWKLSKIFAPEQALDLLEFRRHITIAYLGLCVPRNIAGRGLGIQQKNPDYLKLQSEHILVKNPNDFYRLFRGRGGLVVRSRLWGWRVQGSRPDSTEDPPCMGPVAR
ncbi:hypothetical protein AVEN_215951-1 [Araneus ventricosus]|uniref:PiggyBac transposable element-derived protein domain-containing protein n=1 Tax=Araneus ventricosus TaxID=182803 RepID=A0A4Y2RNP5_ARAVE|nr:hypothetical protein AVEN_215951-1 [Araneus ventricosus]